MKTKLLYITNQICGSGGLERVLSIKASYLANKLNYEVHILTLNQRDTQLFYNFSDKIIHHDVQLKFGNKVRQFLNYLSGLNKVVKLVKPDVISVCDDGLKGFYIPWFINKPCPMVYERHVSKSINIKIEKDTLISKLKARYVSRLMSLGAKNYNKFVVLTKGNLNEWKLNNIEVISNPLSFYPSKTSNLNNKKILVVGKQSYQKGYDRLLNSWKLISNHFPDWKLEIYGTINKSMGLYELASKLEIQDSVTFYPPVKNIGEKYQEASIYVMSSRFEGFGMVLIESMSYGLPCISFDCPYGPADIITHGVDGYIVSNGNIVELSQRMTDLIKNKPLRAKMGLEARKNVTRYAPEIIVPQWDKLFKNLINLQKA